MISGRDVWSLADFMSSFWGGLKAHGHLNLEADEKSCVSTADSLWLFFFFFAFFVLVIAK